MAVKSNPKNKNGYWVVSANDLLSGHVVYLCENNQWRAQLQSALVCSSEQNHTLLDMAGAFADQIVGAELVPVTRNGAGELALLTLRDLLRDSGPSHRSYLSRQQSTAGAQHV